jgi:hypothetical protein
VEGFIEGGRWLGRGWLGDLEGGGNDWWVLKKGDTRTVSTAIEGSAYHKSWWFLQTSCLSMTEVALLILDDNPLLMIRT